MYIIIDKVDGYTEESKGNKYFIFASADKNKKVLIKCTEIFDEIKYLIKTINGGKPSEYAKDFIKIKFNSDDNFPLNKVLKLHNLTIVVRCVFQEDSKY